MKSAGIALIVRIPFVKKIAISADFLSETIDLAVWSVLEPSLGIMAGCIASIRPLFKNLGFGLNRSKRYSSKPQQYGRKHWYGSSNNMKKLNDDRSGGSFPAGSTGSAMELKGVEIVADKGHLASRPRTSAWDVEAAHGAASFRSDEGINVETSIDVVSHRPTSVSERSSEEDLALTRDLASHGGVRLPIPLGVYAG
jgi:hypothetical protein